MQSHGSIKQSSNKHNQSNPSTTQMKMKICQEGITRRDHKNQESDTSSV